MDDFSGDPERGHRFRRLYVDAYPDVLRFVQRRVSDGAGRPAAEDVTAEVFLAVWRRVDDVPADSDTARAWVFGIARNLLLNDNRGRRRRRALGVRLADAEHLRELDRGAVEVPLRVDLERAWRELGAVHQEVLALAVFEGLDSREASAVIGITPTAFRLRLSRARRTLRSLLGSDHELPGPQTHQGPHVQSPERI